MVATDDEHRASATVTKALNQAVDGLPADLVMSATSLLREVAEHRDKAAFVQGIFAVLDEVLEEVGTDEYRQGQEWRSPYSTLLEFLEHPRVQARLRQDDPLAPARARGMRAQERLINAEGGSMTAARIADSLQISRQAVDKRRKTGKLIGVTLGRRGNLYPSWQIGLEGLEPVLHELRGYSPWAKLAFMLSPNNWLDGKTPLAALRQGRIGSTVNAARLYGEHAGV